MSEPSILDYASMQGVDEVMASVGQRVQMMISTATEMATSLSHRRAEQAREAAARSEAAQRPLKERQDALYEADRLVWRRVWDDRFWERATPERIARAWEVCAPWAREGFSSAQATIEHMRSEISDRFGVDVDPVEVRGSDLASLLGVDSDARTDTPTTDPEPGRPDTSALQSISYRIRDPQSDGAVAETGVVHLAFDDGAEVARQVAAERLTAFQQQHGGPAHGFTIDVFQGDQAGTGTLLYTMDARTAEEIRDRYSMIVAQGRQADARAAGTDGGTAEVAAVLRLERRRLREVLKDLPDHGPDAGFVAAAGQAPELGEEWIAGQATEIRDQIGRVGVRLQAAEADLRGEDGDVVVRWAALRYELDEQWWQSATGEEAAAVWEQATGWPEGQARDQALDHLRAAFHREYEVEVPSDTSPQQVREAINVKTRRDDTRGTSRDGAGDDARGTAEELRRRSSAEDAEEQRAHEAGNRMGKDDPGSSAAQGEHEWAQEQRDVAEQDRAAAGIYERLAEHGQAEAADAGNTVARAYPAPPSARVNKSAQARRQRRGTTKAPARAKAKGPRIEPEIGR